MESLRGRMRLCGAGSLGSAGGRKLPSLPPSHSPVQAGGGRGAQQEHRAVSTSPANSHHRVKPTGLGGLGGVCCTTCGQTGTTSLKGAPRKCSPLILSLPESVTVSGLFLVCTQLGAALCESLSFVCQVCHVTPVWEWGRGPSPSVESEQGVGSGGGIELLVLTVGRWGLQQDTPLPLAPGWFWRVSAPHLEERARGGGRGA